MESTIKESNLIYHHVNIITKLKKSSHFKSDFLDYSDCDNNHGVQQNLVFSGYLKTIDPISRSVILAIIDTTNNTVKSNILILGQNIDTISKSSGDSLIPKKVETIFKLDNLNKLASHPYYKRDTTKYQLTDEELVDLQNEIISWLKKNRIPVEFDQLTNNIIVNDIVRIKAPYEHITDYICPTRIVLKRIKHIIDSRKMKQNLS